MAVEEGRGASPGSGQQRLLLHRKRMRTDDTGTVSGHLKS